MTTQDRKESARPAVALMRATGVASVVALHLADGPRSDRRSLADDVRGRGRDSCGLCPRVACLALLVVVDGSYSGICDWSGAGSFVLSYERHRMGGHFPISGPVWHLVISRPGLTRPH